MDRLSSLFVNPVLNKEVKLRFRSFKSFLGIFLYLFVLGAVSLAFIYIESSFGYNGFTAEDSRTLFMLLSMGQMGLIVFMAPSLTAGAISGEREKQTLNILLTTQQSSTAIILSKLFSSLAFLILILIASLPLYSLVFLYGGVSPKMVLLTFCYYLLTMLTIGSLGIMFSTIIRKTMVATITTYGVMLFLCLGTALLFFLFMQMFFHVPPPVGTNQQHYLPYMMLMLNPGVVLFSSFEPGIFQELQRLGITWPLWKGFTFTYIGITIFSLLVGINRLRPSMRPKLAKKKG